MTIWCHAAVSGRVTLGGNRLSFSVIEEDTNIRIISACGLHVVYLRIMGPCAYDEESLDVKGHYIDFATGARVGMEGALDKAECRMRLDATSEYQVHSANKTKITPVCNASNIQ